LALHVEINNRLTELSVDVFRRTTAAGVEKAILDKAIKLGLPVTKKDIKVHLSGGRIVMKCKYSVPVDLIVHTYQWEFEHDVNRPVFIV